VTVPYYQDDLVTLYLGAAVPSDEYPAAPLVTAWLDADVMATDPPYGVKFQSNHRRRDDKFEAIVGDESTEIRDSALAAWGEKPALVFGTWRAPRPEGVRQRLIWAKGEDPGTGDLTMPWGYGDEEIYVLGRGWSGTRRTNVYRFPKVAHMNNPGHPTPKPVPLMEALIEYAPPGVITDPFAGSGATLIAARNLGRRVIGVEIREAYCEVIVRRLSQQAFDFGSIEEVRASGWTS